MAARARSSDDGIEVRVDLEREARIGVAQVSASVRIDWSPSSSTEA
jgi:hypothetical protein